jgi:hypothetical protein
MPSAVADSLFHRLIDAFPPHRVYAPAAFERDPMPPPVAHFLRHWLRHRLRQEASHLELPHSDWFDYEHEEVQHARQGLADALSEHGHFPAAVWETSLREATQQVTAYLVRPAATLASFVFLEEKRAAPIPLIDWRLGYFKGYGYFYEAMRLYVEQKEVREIDRAHFADLLYKIDRKITKDYDASAWLRLLAPLFDLVRCAGAGPGVPTPLLQAFFKEKDAEPIVQRLHRAAQHRSVETLDEATLRRLLEAADEPLPVVRPPMMPSDSPGQPQGAVPRWKQYQQGEAHLSSGPQRAPQGFARTPDERRAYRTSREAQPRWMQFRPDPAPEPAASSPLVPMDLAAVEQAVLGEAGARNRDVFVNNLFAHSLDDYERVLRYLYTAPTWAEASQIIAEEVFRRHQINIYSDSAILFTDTAEARFLGKDGE